MKKLAFKLIALGILFTIGFYLLKDFCNRKPKPEVEKNETFLDLNNHDIMEGDIIFHTSLSSQSKAIQMATNSTFSHCGIIFKIENDFYVYEAVEPVKSTLLSEWMARGLNGKYVIKRLKNAKEILSKIAIDKMKKEGNKLKGKHYDFHFEWSDERIYCSELIWKVYKNATGIEVGKLEKLKDFDLSSDLVKRKMKERYGLTIPLDEIVISPVSIFNCDKLVTVKSN